MGEFKCPESCSCSPGCTARHTEEHMTEEISAACEILLMQ